jgi:hypothetical protein
VAFRDKSGLANWNITPAPITVQPPSPIEYGCGMNMIEPTSGTVVLRGIIVGLGTPVAAAFCEDAVRHIEGLIDASALRSKYGLDDTAWEQLATNEPLQRPLFPNLCGESDRRFLS